MKSLTLPLLALGLLALPAAHAAPIPDWLHIPSARYSSLADPVFGGTIAVAEAGPEDAPTVVLVHGLTNNGARDWQSVIPTLAKKYHVIAPDLPGFGYSSKGNHLYSPERLAQAVHAAVTHLTDGPIALVGHSMGGAVALSYAHQYPAELNQLILVDMAGVLHRSIYTAYIGMQGTRWLTGTNIDSNSWLGQLITGVADYVQSASITPTLILHSPTLRAQILGGRPEPIAGYALVTQNFSAALWQLKLPTLLIWGSDDPLAPPRTGRMVAGDVAGAKLAILDGVEHMPMMQAHAKFMRLLTAQLDGSLELPAYRLDPKAPGKGAAVTCDGEANRHFTGTISNLRLHDCPGAVLERANIGHLQVSGGSLRIVNSHIFSGITARNSELTLTAGSVHGAPPLQLENTAVDAAGIDFSGQNTVAHNTGNTPLKLTFSVCRQRNDDGGQRYLHEVVQLSAGDSQ